MSCLLGVVSWGLWGCLGLSRSQISVSRVGSWSLFLYGGQFEFYAKAEGDLFLGEDDALEHGFLGFPILRVCVWGFFEVECEETIFSLEEVNSSVFTSSGKAVFHPVLVFIEDLRRAAGGWGGAAHFDL